ncbi:MAG: hypothetical protein K2V38_26315 [Gemmataceae bacterium]|nr:hypothetical protein [Gemmataceae bacterium]
MDHLSASVLLLACGVAVPDYQRETAQVNDAVAKFVALKWSARYLDELKDKRDVASLTAIAQSGEPFSDGAAGRAVACLPPHRITAYINKFSLGSPAWCCALHTAARQHPKEVAVGYIKWLLTQPLPENTSEERSNAAKVRWKCYGICSSQGWDDLAEVAQTEVSDERSFYLVNTGLESVGDAARRYLESLANRSPSLDKSQLRAQEPNKVGDRR